MHDEYYVFLESIRAAMMQFMWQADLQGFAKFDTDCLDVYADADPSQSQTSAHI